MPTELEHFTARFIQALLRNSPTNTNYVLTTTLVSALHEAMRSPGSPSYEYPTMMFRNAEQHTVQTADEEQAAAAEGFSRVAPVADLSYPNWFTERPQA
jgi:hypothetical protein